MAHFSGRTLQMQPLQVQTKPIQPHNWLLKVTSNKGIVSKIQTQAFSVSTIIMVQTKKIPPRASNSSPQNWTLRPSLHLVMTPSQMPSQTIQRSCLARSYPWNVRMPRTHGLLQLQTFSNKKHAHLKPKRAKTGVLKSNSTSSHPSKGIHSGPSVQTETRLPRRTLAMTVTTL